MILRALPLLILLSACADFPEVNQAVAAAPAAGPAPALLPLDQINPTVPAARAEASGDALAARVAALQARAAALRAR